MVVCYGVRETERPFFEKLNKYGFALDLQEELLSHGNVDTAKGAEAVIIRGNCKADAKNIETLAGFGVKYILTRTVGINHIDMAAARTFGMRCARVPEYSPNAIGELAVTLAMMLLRHTAHMITKTKDKDFRVDSEMFSRELRHCKVGILGTGKIGLTTARLFKGLGATILCYDIVENDAAKEVGTYLPLDDVLKNSDIISIHVPFIKGKTGGMINSSFLSTLKPGAILINTARGELADDKAILEALKGGGLAAYGTDVLNHEGDFFFRDMKGKQLPTKELEELWSLYPRVLITPHIGSYTDEATTNMIEISYENLQSFLTTNKCANEILI